MSNENTKNEPKQTDNEHPNPTQTQQIKLQLDYILTQQKYLAHRAIDSAEERDAVKKDEIASLRFLIAAHERGITGLNSKLETSRVRLLTLEEQNSRQANLISILLFSIKHERAKEMQLVPCMGSGQTLTISKLCCGIVELGEGGLSNIPVNDVIDSLMEWIKNSVFDGELSDVHAARLRKFLLECASTLDSFKRKQSTSDLKRLDSVSFSDYQDSLQEVVNFLVTKLNERNGNDCECEFTEGCTLVDQLKSYSERLVQFDDDRLDKLEAQIKNADELFQKQSQQLEQTQIQLTTFKNEREKLISTLHHKHSESISFYERVKSLEVHLTTERDKSDKYRLEAEKTGPLEDKLSKMAERINKIVSILNSETKKLNFSQNFVHVFMALIQVFVSILDPQMDSEVEEFLSVVSAREKAIETELEKVRGELGRLRSHMLTNEETYTEQLLSAEKMEKSMRNRLSQVEDQVLKATDSVYETNSRAFHEQEKLRLDIEKLEDESFELNKAKEEWQTRALMDERSLRNLETVLGDFQLDKTSLEVELEESRAKLEEVLVKEIELKSENETSKKKLEDALEELRRFGGNEEEWEKKLERLKSKLSLENRVRENAEKLLVTRREEFIEIAVVKNIILNYLLAGGNQRTDLLRLIGRILSFSEEEFEKVGLMSSWIPTMLIPQSYEAAGTNSLGSEFISFLKKESSLGDDESAKDNEKNS